MLKLCRVTKVKVRFLVLVYGLNFNLFEFSAAILEKGLLSILFSFFRGQWYTKEKNCDRHESCGIRDGHSATALSTANIFSNEVTKCRLVKTLLQVSKQNI